jgi:response regulator RpfG family c-di-GMP phosphodiesterase
LIADWPTTGLRRLEKDMMARTLQGSIKTLTDMLALVKPMYFGKISRLKRIAYQLAKELKYPDLWEVSIAAQLCNLGFVSIPDDVIKKYYAGENMSQQEKKMMDNNHEVSVKLIENIPRLEKIANIIKLHKIAYSQARDEKIQLHPISRILKVANDYIEFSGLTDNDEEILKMMNTIKLPQYDPKVLEALKKVVSISDDYKLMEVEVRELKEGMIFAKDIEGKYKNVLIPRGQEVTQSIKVRLINFIVSSGIDLGKVPVLIPGED